MSKERENFKFFLHHFVVLQMLTPEEISELLKAILKYMKGEDHIFSSRISEIVFFFMRVDFEEELKEAGLE